MADYCVKNYSPQGMYQNYGYYYPSYYGAYTPQYKTSLSNDTLNYTLPCDTVSFRANNSEQTEPPKKKGLSKGAKWAIGILGIAVTIYGCVVAHRAINKPTIEKVTKNFSEIFRRDIPKDEATQMIERYKEIFKEKDKDKFIQRCFEQAKKDFGYENLNIKIGKLPQEKIDKEAKNGFKLGGGYYPVGVVFNDASKGGTEMVLNNIVVEINPNLSKPELFERIIHELTHAKQHEMVYRMNKQSFYDAIREARLATLEGKPELEKIANEYIAEIEKIYGNVWGKLPKINEGSKEYELAQKYLEDLRHYKKGGKSYTEHNEYIKQFIEQEAKKSGDLATEIYNYFSSIWRIKA